jgi:hypothetical protein
MEAELIQKGLWDMISAKVDMDGKTDDEMKIELQKLLVKSSAKMTEVRASFTSSVTSSLICLIMIPRSSGRCSLQSICACGLGTRMTLQWKFLTVTKGTVEAMSAWISCVKGMALDLESIGVNED